MMTDKIPKVEAFDTGNQFVIHCPFCREFHSHGRGEGIRAAHCEGALRWDSPHRVYWVVLVGRATAAMRKHIRRRRKREDPFAFLRWVKRQRPVIQLI